MAHAPSDDQELLRQLAKGNRDAFHACYERYHGPIYRFAWHMTGLQTSAEEVTQEVFLRLIHNPRKFDPSKGTLAGYLFGIARNVMRADLRGNGFDVPLDEDAVENDDSLAAESDILLDIDRKQRIELLQKFVLALPEPYREALVLCELQEMSYPQAAAILDCAEGTVASRVHRARNLLRSRFKATGCMR